VRPAPALPDAAAVLKMGLDLTMEETTEIRMAMAIHTASKQPKLTWNGWRHIAVAVNIGAKHARKEARGCNDTPDYRRVMTDFLKGTGFTFLNKDDRAAAVRMLPHWHDIDAWRSSLSQSRQQVLNNPRKVEREYNEHRRTIGDPDTKAAPAKRKHRQFPSWIEQMEALAEQLAMAEERAERAERGSAYFASMMDEVAKAAKMSDDDVSAICKRVRASHEAADEED
jgi:Xaa-Pro aminopeptidase